MKIQHRCSYWDVDGSYCGKEAAQFFRSKKRNYFLALCYEHLEPQRAKPYFVKNFLEITENEYTVAEIMDK